MAHVLLVDENPVALRYLDKLLTQAGHRVTWATGEDAAAMVLRSTLHPLVLFARSVYDPAHLPADAWITRLLATIRDERDRWEPHTYVLLAWRAREHDESLDALLTELAIPVLFLPCPPDTLLTAVAEAAARLPTR
jgi:CheY-like chemotaxis protein